MTLRKKPAAGAPKAAAAKIKSVTTNDVTVDIAQSGRSNEKVVILFSNRQSQRFALPSGREVVLVHNAVHLAGRKAGVLPAGGYSVNIVDKADWEEVKKIYGKAYKPWFDFGKIIERTGLSEDGAVTLAADNAGDDAGSNPIDPKSSTLKTKPHEEDD